MHPLMFELLPLVRQGFCCSQLLVLLLQQASGRENPALVRAMHGLCNGLGDGEGPCGLLTGGACVLACVAGKGQDEEPNPLLTPLISDYRQWFAARTHGKVCFELLEEFGAAAGAPPPRRGDAPSPALCGDLLVECWEKLVELLEAYELPLEPRS